MENGLEKIEVKDSDIKVEIDLNNGDTTSSNENKSSNIEKKKKNRGRKYGVIVKKFGCVISDGGDTTVEKSEGDGSFDVEAAGGGKDYSPTHLIIMVNGIIGSAKNWRYAAKQFVKAYPQDVIVHCSEANSNMLTFDGVDVMGKRLADEVWTVIRRHPTLQKISFIGHSLGGLVARYCIARLYEREAEKVCEENRESRIDRSKESSQKKERKDKIAGLEPINFITSATPHLGSRGHKQVPVFCGFNTLELLARHTSWLFRRTGKHLFLIDSDNGKPPLLLQMANDSEDLKFISALRSFKRRVAYANVRFDTLVGWSTSSLRRRHELPKRRSLLLRDNNYPHIVNIERAESFHPQDEISLEAKPVVCRSADMEEIMIRGLTSMSWERVDVNFSGSKQRLLAHSTIQVKNKCLYSDGADVIQHMVDTFLL